MEKFMAHSCKNCIFLKKQSWNMVRAYFYSCEKGMAYGKDMFKDKKKCLNFEPSMRASNTYFLKELHEHFTDGYAEKQMHVWRIVDDMSKTHKRISGNSSFWMCFRSEKELDEFYLKHKDIIKNAELRLDYTV